MTAPMAAAGFRQMLRRTAEESGIGLSTHPHMLRHACGVEIANKSPRHAGSAALSQPQGNLPHRTVQRAVERGVQRLLEGLRHFMALPM